MYFYNVVVCNDGHVAPLRENPLVGGGKNSMLGRAPVSLTLTPPRQQWVSMGIPPGTNPLTTGESFYHVNKAERARINITPNTRRA